MKRIGLTLSVIFLTVLYIGPVIFAPSYSHTSVEQNTVKDFAIAEESIILASAGSAYGPTGTYADTHDKDASYYLSSDVSGPYTAWMYLNFSLSEIPANISSIEVSFFGRGSGAGITSNLFAVYDGGSFVDLDDLPIHATVNSWINLTLTDSAYWSTDDTVQFYFEFTATSTGYAFIYADYMELKVDYTPPRWHALTPAQIDLQTHGWYIAGDADARVLVSWGAEVQFGYDAFFIFLGLIMIPASTMYLVHGGRKGMNADKLFYGIVIFALGIGFLIGGIMP